MLGSDQNPTAAAERLLTLAQAARLDWLPRRRHGRPLAASTVWRWATRGVGGVRLRTVRVGGAAATTEAWLEDFFAGCAENDRFRPQGPRLIAHPSREQIGRNLAANGIW